MPSQLPNRCRLLLPALALLVGAVLLCTGCVTLQDPEASQEYRAHTVATVAPGQVVGQTLVSRRAGLNAVSLWLQASTEAARSSGSLRFELYHQPGDARPLVVQQVPYRELTANSPFTLNFAPQPGPAGQAYYLTLQTSGTELAVLGRSEDAYPEGTLLVNGQPQDKDLAFRLSYDYGLAAMAEDAQAALPALWLVIPLVACLWLPGRLLLNLAGLEGRFDPGERAAISVGLSLAVIPVAMTWTSLAGWHWRRPWVELGFLLLAVVLAARVGLQRRAAARRPAPAAPGGQASTLGTGPALLLGLFFLLALAFRLAMVRDLPVSPWVDSVHHALLARLVAEAGAFPASYAPFIEITSASYHAGFHSLVAVFAWLSGLEIPTAMLLLGQVLNTLALLAVYTLTTTLVKERLAGLGAALITGFFTLMPTYYTSWGRYTQLAGLLILPAAAALLLAALQRLPQGGVGPGLGARLRASRGLVLLGGLACAGVVLTHYRVAAFLACLLAAWLLTALVDDFWRRRAWLEDVLLLGCAALLAALFSLPWWPAALQTLLLPKLSWSPNEAPFSDFSWNFLTTGYGIYTVALALLGLGWALALRRRFAATVALWTALLFLLANLGVLRLPGAGFINNLSVEISLFMPISLLGGYLASWLVRAWLAVLPPGGMRPFQAGLALAGIILALVGARSLMPVFNPVTLLYRQADSQALAWVARFVPASETVLINPFAWGYGVYAGNDGGYWASPIAGRKTMPPPVLYGMDNRGEVLLAISETCRQVVALSDQPQALHDYLLAQDLHYIFIGRRGGALSPKLLAESPLYKLLYAQDGAWVFGVLPAAASP